MENACTPEVNRHISDLLDQYIITLSTSPLLAPVILFKKQKQLITLIYRLSRTSCNDDWRFISYSRDGIYNESLTGNVVVLGIRSFHWLAINRGRSSRHGEDRVFPTVQILPVQHSSYGII